MDLHETVLSTDKHIPLIFDQEKAELEARLARPRNAEQLVAFKIKNFVACAGHMEQIVATILLINAFLMKEASRPILRLVMIDDAPERLDGWDVYPAVNALRMYAHGGYASLKNVGQWVKATAQENALKEDVEYFNRLTRFAEAAGSDTRMAKLDEAEIFFGTGPQDFTMHDGGHFTFVQPDPLRYRFTSGPVTAVYEFNERKREHGFEVLIDRTGRHTVTVFDAQAIADGGSVLPALRRFAELDFFRA